MGDSHRILILRVFLKTFWATWQRKKVPSEFLTATCSFLKNMMSLSWGVLGMGASAVLRGRLTVSTLGDWYRVAGLRDRLLRRSSPLVSCVACTSRFCLGVLGWSFFGVSSTSSILSSRWLVVLVVVVVEFSVAFLGVTGTLMVSFLAWGGEASTLGLGVTGAGFVGEGAEGAAGLASVVGEVSAGLDCGGCVVTGLTVVFEAGTPLTLGTVWVFVGASDGLLASTGF